MKKITNFNELKEELRKDETIKIAIAWASTEEVLLANMAKKEGLAEFILIGDKANITKIMTDNNIDVKGFEIIDVPDDKQAASRAIGLVREKKADIPMKGLLHTATFMKAVLDKQTGLETKRRISQITLFQDNNGEIKFLTDCAINVEQSLKVKIDIINNAVEVAHSFGFTIPKVALLGAVETINHNMEDTVDSAVLTQMNNRGQITGCLVDGPLSLDNAISVEAAQHKGVKGEVAGRADILVASSLQEANTFSKSLHFYANFETASIIAGTVSPFIMTSRTDALENKLNSIAATCYYAKNNE